MVFVEKGQTLEDYQLQELQEKKLFINKYDLSLKYLYELNVQWKEFFFDLLAEMTKIDVVYLDKQDNLLEYLKEDYKTVIKEWNLKIDIRDYVDLTDYISLEEWEKETNNFIVGIGKHYHLISISHK